MKKNAGTKPCKTNPVAKFNSRINRSAAFRDRKKAEKRGYSRYKTQYREFQDDNEMISARMISLSS